MTIAIEVQASRPSLAMTVFLSFLAGACAADIATPDTYSVKLKRQQIPLHSDGGVVHHKSAYHGEISVGGPIPQVFDVVFDTGSGHLVLPSTLCASASCKKHRRYKRRASKLSRDIDVDGTLVRARQARDQITVSFGTGEVTGIFQADYVCLGPPFEPNPPSTIGASLLQMNKSKLSQTNTFTEAENTTDSLRPRLSGCSDLRLIAAMDMSDDPFDSFTFDGIFGLGLSALSQTPEFNFMTSAASSGAWHGAGSWTRRTFAVFLAVSDEEESEITFGGWNAEHIQEGHEIAWSAVQDAQEGYWQLSVVAIRANGVTLNFCDGAAQCRAIVDTGTSLVGVPSALSADLMTHLRHVASGTSGGCDGPGPQLEIDLGKFTIVLDPVDYARPEIVAEVAHGAVDKSASVIEEETTCVPMIMHIDLPQPLSPKTLILGEPVLQKYYTAFDGAAPRVGFVEAAHVAKKSIKLAERSAVKV